MFGLLSRFAPTQTSKTKPAGELEQLTGGQYAELLAPYDTVNDFSTSSLLKENGDNLTSEKLAKLSVEDMVKTVLAKAGVVSFSRVVRIVKDALTLAGGESNLLDKGTILDCLLANSVTVLAETQSFIAESTLVFPESKQKSAIRDAVILSLLKSGSLNET